MDFSKWVWVGILLGFSRVVWASPENGRDAMDSITRYGPGVLIQSIEISRHFFKADEVTENFFVKQQLAQEEALKPKFLPKEPLSWRLGFTYNHSESAATVVDPVIIDNTYTGIFGLYWQTNPLLGMGIRFNFDSIPEENYTHASGVLQVEYTLPLRTGLEKPKLKKKPEPKGGRDSPEDLLADGPEEAMPEEAMEDSDYDPDNALQYYRHQRKERAQRTLAVKGPPKDYEDDLDDNAIKEQTETLKGPPTDSELALVGSLQPLYPNLKFGLALTFSIHSLRSKILRRISLGQSGVLGGNLNHYSAGGELVFSPSQNLSWHMAAAFSGYGGSVNEFGSLIESDFLRKQAIIAQSGISSAGNQLFVFPVFTFDESLRWDVTSSARLQFNANQTIYQSAFLDPTYAFGPSYTRYLGQNWEGGVEANFILAGIAGFNWSAGLGIGYHL